MVKSYAKYEASHTFGTVTSAIANTIWTFDSETAGRHTGSGVAVVGANEEILRWDVKKGELISRWKDGMSTATVTALARSGADSDVFAAGYEDGSIKLWDARTGTVIINFNGHKSAITSLAFDKSGVRLASGSRDTDIIIWDLVAEVGLFKLRGHKDQIVLVQFLQPAKSEAGSEEEEAVADDENFTPGYIISASKDALIKVWDITSQHCVETHVAQSNGECSAFAISPDSSGCISAGADGELKVWAIDGASLLSPATPSSQTKCLTDRGILRRSTQDRTTGVSFHPRGGYIAVHGAEKSVEIWRIRTVSEIQRSLARKAKRRKEKAAAVQTNGDDEGTSKEQTESSLDISTADVSEVFVPYTTVRTSGKSRSIDWSPSLAGKSLHLLTAMSNNLVETYRIPTKQRSNQENDSMEPTRLHSVDLPGHRTDVRSLALSSDDRMVASASSGALKIWNARTETCLRTLECGYALCCSFLPGDKIVLVGTKSGELELFDIASSTLIDRVQAHENAIWALHVHPDGRSVVTGSADKSAKFWNFEIVQEEIPGTKRTTPKLKLVHTRTLKVNDDILSLCFSPDARLLAVSTLDNTVKVFFTDTLKLFLNLYGHKLPVLSMSISSDSKLIATSSADKNVRIWGLDFGDCHRALFAHNDSIMQVKFIPQPSSEDGHFFFSASKDHAIKTWDGDKFEQVQKIDGHHGEIWAMSVSRTGEFVVTSSHDKSIRVWFQSDEPIFLEEERERQMEELYESTLTTSLEADVDGEYEQEGRDRAVAATKQTIATLTAGERIVEALELGKTDLEVMEDWHRRKALNPKIAPPDRDPVFLALNGISAERHVLNTISKIPPAQLHDALLVLPFSVLPTLFTFLGIWIRMQWHTALVCRVLFFMLKTHQRQIVGSKELKVQLEDMRRDLKKSLGGMKNSLGLNYVALGFVEQRVQEKSNSRLEDVESNDPTAGRKKRAFVDVS
ncbi:WD domain-containing protein [Rhizodiscina lignyota]|uniref:WD domain-containing protein n=1 Tax=Rhizodiscina lignyota TaxID=1504668 RepID=A0A9P4IHN8_9PEZI|nr:WD domain-containing protein [Rhizodiscina lignyota]